MALGAKSPLQTWDGSKVLDDFNVSSLQIVKDYLADDITICDIGGFRGEFAEECLKLFPQKVKKILIFEPYIENYQKIRIPDSRVIVISKGIFYGSKTCHPKGTGDENAGGMVVGNVETSHILNDIQKNPLVEYSDVTFKLDELENYVSSEDNLGVCKLDAEASEYNIIEHSSVLKKFPYIIVEWHNRPYFYIKDFIAKHLPQYSVLDRNGRHHTLLSL